MRQVVLIIMSALCGFSAVVQANTEQVTTDQDSTWYLAVGRVSLDEKAAASEAVKDDANYFRLGWQRRSDAFVFGLGLSSYIYKDRAGFSQEVEDYFGDVSTEDSSATSFNLFGELGYSHPLSSMVRLELVTGFELVLSSERSINNCSDCYSEDIDLDSGAYIMPRVLLQTEKGFTAGLAYQHFINGDVEKGPSLVLGWSY